MQRGHSPLFHLVRMIDLNNITAIIEKKLEGTDQFLVEVRLSPGKLCVFIDKPAGILLEDCIALNRFLFQELDPAGFNESHEIEVSSPGMDKPLRVYKQYLRRIGRNVKVVTSDGILHKGKLLQANDSGFEIAEVIEKKENKKKIIYQSNIHLKYNEVKEVKIEF